MTDVVIAIDDLHPEEGWGCEGDESVGYLEELNKEFGRFFLGSFRRRFKKINTR